MILKLYPNPKNVGWLGWIETCRGAVAGFVKLDGTIITNW